MGTRRSKHNRGRKPVYKEHGSDSVRHFEQPKPVKEKIVPLVRNFTKRSPIVWDEGKKTASAEAVQALPPPIEKYIVPTLNEAIEAGNIVGVSTRDFLLQLYAERKIDNVLLRAGRLWQHHMEISTIQPCQSIDPGVPNNMQRWQKDGELTEAQHRAMTKRRIVSAALGIRGVRFLDLVLSPDIGRADAMRLAGMSGARLFHVLNWLLNGLAVYYGFRIGASTEYEEFQVLSDMRELYEFKVSRENTNATVSGIVRTFNDEDTETIRLL